MKTILVTYWILAVLIQAIYAYYARKQFLEAIKKRPELMSLKDAFMQQANIKLFVKKMFSWYAYIIYGILFCIISPFLLPSSLAYFFKKLTGYKTKLEKQADEETKAMEEAHAKSKEWMRTEGVYSSDEPI